MQVNVLRTLSIDRDLNSFVRRLSGIHNPQSPLRRASPVLVCTDRDGGSISTFVRRLSVRTNVTVGFRRY